MLPWGDAQVGDASHKAEITSPLLCRGLDGQVAVLSEEEIPNWYLSLLTADIKDLSPGEQKEKNIIVGLIRLFSPSKYCRLRWG